MGLVWKLTTRHARSARFTAYGMADLSLDCNETMYRNPNWTMGQIYSSRQIKCLPVTLDISPYEMEAVA